MNRAELNMELQMIKSRADVLLKKSEYAEWGEVCFEKTDESEAERFFWEEQLNSIMCSLEKLCSKIKYMNGKIVCEGMLSINTNDRYCCGDYELCCGYGMEILIFDEWKGVKCTPLSRQIFFIFKLDSMWDKLQLFLPLSVH